MLKYTEPYTMADILQTISNSNLIQISQKLVREDPTDNKPALV